MSERDVIRSLVATQEVVRHGNGEHSAAPSVRARSPDQRRVVVQQHAWCASLAVAELFVSPTTYSQGTIQSCCGNYFKLSLQASDIIYGILLDRDSFTKKP